MRKRIAIDMDETICDTLQRHLDWYNQEFGANLQKRDLHGKKIYTCIPAEHLSRVRVYPDNPEYFVDLTPFADAISTIEALSREFDIYIATAAMEHPTSFVPKFAWLKQYLPFISPLNIVFCGQKSIVRADYLIDDSSRHFNGFSGQGILFSAPHNVDEKAEVRVNNWLEVRDYFLKNNRA